MLLLLYTTITYMTQVLIIVTSPAQKIWDPPIQYTIAAGYHLPQFQWAVQEYGDRVQSKHTGTPHRPHYVLYSLKFSEKHACYLALNKADAFLLDYLFKQLYDKVQRLDPPLQ